MRIDRPQFGQSLMRLSSFASTATFLSFFGDDDGEYGAVLFLESLCVCINFSKASVAPSLQELGYNTISYVFVFSPLSFKLDSVDFFLLERDENLISSNAFFHWTIESSFLSSSLI